MHRNITFGEMQECLGPGDGEFALLVTSEVEASLRAKETHMHVRIVETKGFDDCNVAG